MALAHTIRPTEALKVPKQRGWFFSWSDDLAIVAGIMQFLDIILWRKLKNYKSGKKNFVVFLWQGQNLLEKRRLFAKGCMVRKEMYLFVYFAAEQYLK